MPERETGQSASREFRAAGRTARNDGGWLVLTCQAPDALYVVVGVFAPDNGDLIRLCRGAPVRTSRPWHEQMHGWFRHRNRHGAG